MTSNLLRGMVVETNAQSWTGKVLYSDFYFKGDEIGPEELVQDPFLNRAARTLIVGIAAGIIRSALAVIHTVGHLFAALVTRDKGHLYHAAKGCCEFVRGLIEAIPIAGRIFANSYSGIPAAWMSSYYTGTHSWWILKIYNPQKPDLLDQSAGLWNHFKAARPDGYVRA